MRRSALAIALALPPLFACSPGNVRVADLTPKAAPAATAPGAVSTPGPGAGDGSATGELVAFEHVLTEGNLVDFVMGVAFLSSSATTARPGGVALDQPLSFGSQPPLAASPDRLVYLGSNGLMASTLFSTAFADLSTAPVFTFPREATAVSVAVDAGLVAWIDDAGAVSVTALSPSGGTSAAIPLAAGESAARVQLASLSGQRLLVLTTAGALRTFVAPTGAASSEPASWTPELSLPALETAALSADGRHLVTIDSQGVLSRDGAVATTLASADVHDLSVAPDGSVLYWARLAPGKAEVRSLAAGASAESTEAAVTVPDTTGDGVVCPARVAGAVYFASFVRQEYRIVRGASGEDFAIPPASDEGYVCPVAVQGLAAAVSAPSTPTAAAASARRRVP